MRPRITFSSHPLDKETLFAVIIECADFSRRLFTKRMTIQRMMVLLGVLALVAWGFFSLRESAYASLEQADKVIVIKSKRVLMLLKDGEIFRTYKVALGKQPKGHKTRQGDRRTPEGRYVLDSRNPRSKYHLAIHISYPNESDIVSAQKRGVSPGGDIMIHGLPPESRSVGELHSFLDWTDGCIAVTNTEMEEIWQFVADGTPIEIKP